ncbi:alcohol dehydrogenase catalytic domain-containing protein [Nakamurella sp. YIM 132087]|uniref:Alcohol dehydrogenase catalytic domain-containing protein n=1 Tax=Nakamurella alba TaxID=2665158 RepID=A0A7K1FKR1_9ACTN|nr:alcohol dehydrogenase catalytic domain-containing protein [Nakamurella alba]MTD14732.1 alcohol dehydrogenase catalytic domain-containing protein [Nakamurella alba]
MRRVIVRPEGVQVVDAERPEPLPGEVLVEMSVSGVCGSDVHAAAGHHPFVPLPYLPGHEVVGTVRAVGAGVDGVAVGDHITVEPTLPCGECKMCRTGRSHICEHLRFFGCGYDQGGMADHFTVPVGRVHVLPTDITDLQASLIEPLSTPVHAERISGGVEGKAVVIIGAGTIGLLMLAAVRYAGARTVVVTDMLESKRERAGRLGADAVVDAGDPDMVQHVREILGESADVVFDCVALQPTVDQAFGLAQKGGTVVIVGVPQKDVTVPLPKLQDLQMRLQGSATYMPEDYERSIEIIRAGLVRPEDFITATFPLEQAADAFAAAATGHEVKVLVTRELLAG